MRYRLQNRYQDSGWEDTEREFDDPDEATEEAGRLSKDSICWGMVRVVDTELGRVVATFAAGGGRCHEHSSTPPPPPPIADRATCEPCDPVGEAKYPGGLRGWLLWLADRV